MLYLSVQFYCSSTIPDNNGQIVYDTVTYWRKNSSIDQSIYLLIYLFIHSFIYSFFFASNYSISYGSI